MRVAGGARAIAEAHRFEGPHDALWTAEYHADDRGRSHGDSLPASYQRDIASLFSDRQGHDDYDIPAALAEDWLIVTGYLRHASEAITSTLSPSRRPQIANGLR